MNVFNSISCLIFERRVLVITIFNLVVRLNIHGDTEVGNRPSQQGKNMLIFYFARIECFGNARNRLSFFGGISWAVYVMSADLPPDSLPLLSKPILFLLLLI